MSQNLQITVLDSKYLDIVSKTNYKLQFKGSFNYWKHPWDKYTFSMLDASFWNFLYVSWDKYKRRSQL